MGPTLTQVLFSLTAWIPRLINDPGKVNLYFSTFSLSLSLSFIYFAAYGSSQARGRIGATAAGLYHSHSNVGSEPCLPTPQLTAMPDP